MIAKLAMLVLAVTACGSKTDKAKADKAEEFDTGATTGKQMAAKPLVKTPGTARAFKFTIDLPAGAHAETAHDYTNYELGRNPLTGIGVTVTFYDEMVPGSSEPFGEDAAARAIVRNETLPDGGHLTLDARKDHRFFELELWRKFGSAVVACSVMQRVSEKDPAIEDFDAVTAWAERVCRSVAAG
jgi:hypothetical protein